MVHSAQ